MKKISKEIIIFTIPVLLSLFIQALYGAVDLWAVGAFATSDDISAVAIGSEFMQIITQLVVGLTMGVTVLLATNMGSGDKDNCGYIVGTSFRVFLIFGFVLSVIVAVFSPQFAHIMNTPNESFEATVKYIRVCGIGSIAVVFFNLFAAIFRAIGDSKTPFLFVCTTCVINIIGDIVLTKFISLGTLGVAIATTVSQVISCIFALFYIKIKGLGFDFNFKHIKTHRAFTKPMLTIGTPVALQSSITEASYAVVISFANTLGVLASAGVGVASKVIMFVYLVPTAFLQVVSVFVAESLGMKDTNRAKMSLVAGSFWAVLIGAISAYALFFHGDVISRIFTKDESIIGISWEYLKICAIECFVLSFVYCMLGYFNGYGQTKFVMINGLLAIFIVKIPYAYYATFVTEPRVYNIALSDALSSIFQLVLCLGFYFVFRRFRASTKDHRKLE